MKQLTKIRIINWHYFWDETIDVRPIVFLTGVNGSGKSTLIDALQIVLLGDTSGRSFNKAAMEKSNRTLKGYLRGELGDTEDGGFKYLRNGRFTSYIVLEFYDDLNKNSFLMGIVFDSYDDGSEDHHFFTVEGAMPVNNFVENNVPLDYKRLAAFFNENYPKSFTFFDSNKQYQEFLKKKFGGLKDRYFSLFKKATSFAPIADVPSFITDYVCEPQPNIVLDKLQDNILQYKRLENEALNIEKRVRRLEDIQKEYNVYAANLENLKISQYILEKCQLEQAYAKLRSYNNAIERNNARIEEIDVELEDFKSSLEELEVKKTRLIGDRASNDSERIALTLKEEKRNVETKINEINRNIEIVKDNLSSYTNNFYQAASKLLDDAKDIDYSLLGADLEEDFNIAEEYARKVKNSCERFKETFLEDLSKMTKEGLSTFRDDLLLFKQTISKLVYSVGISSQKIEKTIRDLRSQETEMKGGTKTYSTELTIIKQRLESKLEETFNKKIPVSIFADLIDIDDLSWSNAIEGLLSAQKFNLFVAPKYYEDAYKVLRNLLNDFNFYGTALVDEEKIIDRNPICENGSLAEEISTNHEGARAYTNFLLGRVHKSKDIAEARESGNGITKECDLYRNFTLSRLNPKLYRTSFIGRNVGDRFLREKSEQLQSNIELLNIYHGISSILNNANSLEVITTTEIDNSFNLLKRISELSGLIKNKEYIEGELKDSGSPLTSSIDNRIKDIEADIKSISDSRERIILEKGNLVKDIENIKTDKIISEQASIKQMEDNINSHYDPFLVSDKALPIYNQQREEGKSNLEILSMFNVEQSRLNYQVNSLKNSIIKLRRDYCNDYHLSYDVENQSNEVFEAELTDFRDVKLPQYREKIQDSYEKATKQFKDDFIFKLRAAIEDVEDQIENLNGALKQSSFGKDQYEFTVRPSQVYKRYYDMLKDDLIINGGKDDTEFITKYKDVMEDLFKQIVDVGNGDKNGLLLENITKFTDYRSYLDFDVIVYNKDTGDVKRLSKMMRKNSGGENQTPFYISVLASFAQLYHVNDEGEIGNTTRLIIFDEAFSKMDRNRMTEAVKLLRKFSLQVILSAPYDKIPDISPLVDETLIVLHDKNKSCVRLFEKE